MAEPKANWIFLFLLKTCIDKLNNGASCASPVTGMCGWASIDDEVSLALHRDLREFSEPELPPSDKEERSQEDLTSLHPMDTEEQLIDFEFSKDCVPITFIKQEPSLYQEDDYPEPTGYSETRTYARVILKNLKIPVGQTLLVCWQCDAFFADGEALTCHLQTHSEDSLVCIFCSERFLDLATLRTHVKTHSGAAIFRCGLCDKQFYEKELLEVHMRAHDTKNRPAKVSHKVGDDPLRIDASDIRLVPSSSSAILPFKCSECGLPFGRKFDLKKHELRHGEAPFACEVCDKRFFNNCNLQYHMKVHEARQPYECVDCDKKFLKKNHLTCHRRQVHSPKVKPFVCKVCKKSFQLKGYLNMHKRTHNDMKNYQCDRCDRTFSTQDFLNEHRKTHVPPRTMKCVVCKRKFADRSALKVHLEMHLEEQRRKGYM